MPPTHHCNSPCFVSRSQVKSDSVFVLHSVVSNSLQPHGLQPTRFLCSWDSPGKNTRVGSHSLLESKSPALQVYCLQLKPPMTSNYQTQKAMAPHSSTFAWKVPWTEEPRRLQSMGSLESGTTERLHFHFSLSSIGEGNGNPLQCSCLENPRDGGAWWAAVYGVAQSWTRLKRLSSSSSSSSSTDLLICVFLARLSS